MCEYARIDGLKALKHFLDERATLESPNDTLVRLAELVLSKSKHTRGLKMIAF